MADDANVLFIVILDFRNAEGMTFHLTSGCGRYDVSSMQMTEMWETLVPPDMLEGVQAQGICIQVKTHI